MSKIDPLNEAKQRLRDFTATCPPPEVPKTVLQSPQDAPQAPTTLISGRKYKLVGEKIRLVHGQYCTCPVCGQEYTCITDIKVYMDNSTWHIFDEKGVHLLPSAANDSRNSRGAVVELTWCCESGHVWRTQYCFHKGTTHKNVQIDGRIDGNDEDFEYLPGPIWRD